jgi:hypothetical protein
MTTNGIEEYYTFLHQKAQLEGDYGFAVDSLPEWLFPFQDYLVKWALMKGRAAIFADCGLGKTPMQLVWANEIVKRTDKRVLILTPLAVGGQTSREAEKFGIEAVHCRDGKLGNAKIIITNYERLHYFDSKDFVGCVCDESSILKNFDGSLKASITEFMRRLPYRLLCTATAAPNDYVELGTSSEALGYLGYVDMLGQFFKNDNGSAAAQGGNGTRFAGQQWRFKPHAEQDFWRWMCSWARAIRRPSDLGFEDVGFDLPNLQINTHVVNASRPLEGMLFAMPAIGLAEQRKERSATVTERCERVATILNQYNEASVAWCQLNAEGDLLEKLMPDAVQVSGKDSNDAKEEKFTAFANGAIKTLITKPTIGAFGLNWQHCHKTTFFPSHSFEQYYQAIRRFWRFGQQTEVEVDIITTEGERDVLQNLQRKADAADVMFERIVEFMGQELQLKARSEWPLEMEIPEWV